MHERIKQFVFSEEAAVSAEFVVMSGGAVGIAIAVMNTMADGAIDAAAAHNANLETKATITYANQAD